MSVNVSKCQYMSVYLWFAIRYNICVEVATKRLLLTLSLGQIKTQQQARP